MTKQALGNASADLVESSDEELEAMAAAAPSAPSYSEAWIGPEGGVELLSPASLNGATASDAEAAVLPQLAAVVETFRRWLYLPDAGPLLVVLGAVAANLLAGDPVWLLIVSPPGAASPSCSARSAACRTLTRLRR
jgi:hypothetical protein